jgi:hypothetical protein
MSARSLQWQSNAPCRWPSVLEERGPPEDPFILLTGAAPIGETEVQIVAIRINATLRWPPDDKRGVAADSYHADGRDEVLETKDRAPRASGPSPSSSAAATRSG